MRGYLLRLQRCPQCAVAGCTIEVRTNIQPTNTTRKPVRELRMHHLDPRKRSYVRVWDPWKLQWKCANNCQLIVVSIQRFIRQAYASRFHIIQTRKTLCSLLIYSNMQTVIGVFFRHGNDNTHACLTEWWNPFYF